MYHYVYLLQTEDKVHHYTGVTNNIDRRLFEHNSGLSKYTSKHLQDYNLWELDCAVMFRDRKKAEKFEAYLKTQSGRRFAKRFL
jgi:predicted GIY-YIG superfamily endonuclease